MSAVTVTYVCAAHGFRSHGKIAVQLHMDGNHGCRLGVERREANPADDVNARQDEHREQYVARDLARLGGRRAVAKDLRVGDRFVAPIRAEQEPKTLESVRMSKGGIRESVIYKAEGDRKSSWLPATQVVIIL